MGRHISDTRTMRWEIHYVHPQYGRRLFNFVDTLRQAVEVCKAGASSARLGNKTGANRAVL